ncbi:MAG: helix-turn-helix transcriptional regulator [Umezawaea sp.]
MGERRSTTRSRDLGTELARIRKAAGLDAKVLAEKLGWPGSKLSRIEQGKQGIEDIELVALLSVCDALGDNLTWLITLSRESSQASWLQMFGNRPTGYARTLDIEIGRATALVYYAFGLIPGMAQTEGYMRALIRPAEDEAIARRLARQEILRGPRSMTATFFIEEQVLRRPVGGAAVMHDQMLRLVFLSQWRRVSIRVVPTSAGAHIAIDGGFFLLDNREERPIVHLETKVARIWLEDPAHIAVYRDAAADLASVALSEDASREFLSQMADEYGRSMR